MIKVSETRALCFLSKGLGSHEPLSETRLESLLLVFWKVSAFCQLVQRLHFRSLFPQEQSLWLKQRKLVGKLKNSAIFATFSILFDFWNRTCAPNNGSKYKKKSKLAHWVSEKIKLFHYSWLGKCPHFRYLCSVNEITLDAIVEESNNKTIFQLPGKKTSLSTEKQCSSFFH